MIETLESRRLCSADTGTLAGVEYKHAGATLHLTGTPGDDTIVLFQLGPTLLVDSISTSGEEFKEFQGVRRVLINTGDGRDAIFQFGGVTASVLAKLGNGDDVAFAGRGKDVLIGGNGNDDLIDFVGRSVLIGQRGDDFILET